MYFNDTLRCCSLQCYENELETVVVVVVVVFVCLFVCLFVFRSRSFGYIKAVINFRSLSRDYMMYDQLLWESTDTVMSPSNDRSSRNVGFRFALFTNGDVTTFVLSS